MVCENVLSQFTMAKTHKNMEKYLLFSLQMKKESVWAGFCASFSQFHLFKATLEPVLQLIKPVNGCASNTIGKGPNWVLHSGNLQNECSYPFPPSAFQHPLCLLRRK